MDLDMRDPHGCPSVSQTARLASWAEQKKFSPIFIHLFYPFIEFPSAWNENDAALLVTRPIRSGIPIASSSMQREMKTTRAYLWRVRLGPVGLSHKSGKEYVHFLYKKKKESKRA